MAAEISIIVPCFDQAEYLDEALESVLKQTYTNWECIIVNDGSPDNTQEVANKWVEKDKRFKYLFQKNEGVSSARNMGIKNSFGKFILPLDADDKLSINYLEICLSKIESENYSIVYGKAICFGEQEAELKLGNPTLKNLLKYNRIHCSGLFRKEDWKRNNGYDENMKFGFEDWEFWINILKRGGEALLMNECILYYRIKSFSRSTEINFNAKKNSSMVDYIFQKHLQLYGYNSLIELHEKKIELEEKLSDIYSISTYKQFLILFIKKMGRTIKTIINRQTKK